MKSVIKWIKVGASICAYGCSVPFTIMALFNGYIADRFLDLGDHIRDTV